MSIQRIPDIVREIYACHIAFTRIGFKAENLKIGYCDPKKAKRDIYIHLNVQNKNFYYPIGIKGKFDDSKVSRQWNKFLQKHPSMPEKELDLIWSKSNIGKSPDALLELMEALNKEGFKMTFS